MPPAGGLAAIGGGGLGSGAFAGTFELETEEGELGGKAILFPGALDAFAGALAAPDAPDAPDTPEGRGLEGGSAEGAAVAEAEGSETGAVSAIGAAKGAGGGRVGPAGSEAAGAAKVEVLQKIPSISTTGAARRSPKKRVVMRGSRIIRLSTRISFANRVNTLIPLDSFFHLPAAVGARNA